MEYDMEELLSSCVHVYCSLAKVSRDSLPEISTPLLLDIAKDDGLGGASGRPYDDAQGAIAELLHLDGH
eukprot:4613992-Prorocentrum_lima.AAC.1